jgi:predicted acetyltransferase
MEEKYGPAAEDMLPELAAMMSWSFAFPQNDAEAWIRRSAIDNVRVVRRNGKIEACCMTIPHAQFFAGRSVPATGVAGVATPAESRGTGAALVMMKEMLRELHERGIALSNLYPASLPLYRRGGYELAGARYEIKVSLRDLPEADRSLPLREMKPEDRPAVEASYRAMAAHTNGFLDRGPYVWGRVFEPRDQRARAFVVGEGDRIDGHAVFYEKRGGSLDFVLVASDFVAHTRAAVARLLTLFADHGTLGQDITWYGSPSSALVHALPALGYSIRVHHAWMIRIVDLPRALAARGYPAGFTGSLDLDVRDDIIDANAGRWVLTVEGGRAEVKRGGNGSVRLDIRALAPLFSAYMTPHDLAVAGALEAPDEDLVRAESMFAAAPPSLADFF